MPGSKSESLGSLQRLSDVLVVNAEDYPQLQQTITGYENSVRQVQYLAREQAAAVASKQDATRRFQFALAEAQRLATVLRFAIKHHYGIDSEKLIEFGIQPFRGRTRKVQEPETPPVPEAPAPAVVPDVTGV